MIKLRLFAKSIFGKKKQGFSMVDIIISVLFLSVLALVALRLVLTANTLSKSTDNLSRASAEIANVVEKARLDMSYPENGVLEFEDSDLVIYVKTKSLRDNLRRLDFRAENKRSKELLLELSTKVYDARILENQE